MPLPALRPLRGAPMLVAVLAFAAPAVLQAQKCAAGSFSATGNQPCTLAAPGYYVKTVGAKVQTPAAAGFYVSSAGASSQTPATPGHYVGTSAAKTQTLAPAGYYVAAASATAPTPAAPGYYVPGPGATAPTAATPGHYVAGTAATLQTSAAPGYYVSGSAATTPTPAAPGYYVSGVAAVGQTAATPGYFVPGSAATSPIAASPGYFVGATAATGQTITPPGSYVPGPGSAAPTPAAPGQYVPNAGMTTPALADIGFYVPMVGATSQTAAAPGFFVPAIGESAETPCATKTSSYGQAPACRFTGGPNVPWVAGAIGPRFDASFLATPVFDLGAMSFGATVSLDAWIRNISTGLQTLGASSAPAVQQLTALTILNALVGPATSVSTAVVGLPNGLVLGEGAVQSFGITVQAMHSGAFDQTIAFATDESAAYGQAGQTYSVRVTGTVLPEPNTMALLGLGLAGLGAMAWRRQRA